eukprot:EC715536.1.p1 GENE.EC715536.1~~EC715536.1.p1  ORF type:complete len:133 (+),score=2.72 EC715536.1:45-443(+)
MQNSDLPFSLLNQVNAAWRPAPVSVSSSSVWNELYTLVHGRENAFAQLVTPVPVNLNPPSLLPMDTLVSPETVASHEEAPATDSESDSVASFPICSRKPSPVHQFWSGGLFTQSPSARDLPQPHKLVKHVHF